MSPFDGCGGPKTDLEFWVLWTANCIAERIPLVSRCTQEREKAASAN